MTPKATSHVIQGMQKDTSKSKLSKEFAFDAKNIRITAREGNTLLTITNEKGTKYCHGLFGYYLGHCVLNNQLVLFTTTPEAEKAKDHIFLYDSNFVQTPLYDGNLNFNLNNPLETLGVYENEDIQKVYWVDGINQPRVINIKKSYMEGNKFKDASSFDFIPELALQESVSVEAVSNSSMFAPGVIQYAFSYYNKYGQESNIFNVSPLCYLTHKDRGASPEEIIKDLAFKVKVTNLDTKFDYVRIYSIHRTSLNAIPTVKRVIDLPVTIPEEYKDIKESAISYHIRDVNKAYLRIKEEVAEGSTIGDLHGKLLSEIVAPQIQETDNATIKIYDYSTFVGGSAFDIIIGKYEGEEFTEIEKVIKIKDLRYIQYIEKISTILEKEVHSYEIKSVAENAQSKPIPFIIEGTIKNSATPDISYTDNGTLGETIDPTQLLYIGGEDIIAGTITSKDNTLFLGNIELKQLSVADDLKASIKDSAITLERKDLNNNEENSNSYHYSNVFINDYSYFKPGEHYRLGVQLQYKNGKWSEPIFIRDYTVPLGSNPTVSDLYISFPSISCKLEGKVKEDILKKGFKRIRGLVVFPEEHERNVIAQGILCPTIYNVGDRESNSPYSQSSWFLRPNLSDSFENASTSNEYSGNVSKGAIVEFRHGKPLITGLNRGSEIQNEVKYEVDQSILNFYSPEIEFNSKSPSVLDSYIRMRIVGIANFDKNYGYIDIQTKTPQASVNASGIYEKSLIDLKNGGRSLVSGLFYEDTLPNKLSTKKYLIYPWHRSGSLNADNASLANSNNKTQSGLLDKKKISNYKFSSNNTWLDAGNIWEALRGNSYNSLANGISKIYKFDSNQVSIVKLDLFNDNNPVNYYGNVDSLLFNPDGYTIKISDTFDGMLEEYMDDEDTKGTEPVRIKYKSAPHYVFGLRKNKNTTIVLPTVNHLNSRNDPSGSTIEIVKPEDKKEINYKSAFRPESPEINDLWLQSYPNYITKDYIILEWTGYNWEHYYGEGRFNLFYVDEANLLIEYYRFNQATHEYSLDRIESATTITTDTPGVGQDSISINDDIKHPFLYIAELYVTDNFIQNAFGGQTEEAIKNNLWLPASQSVPINSDSIVYEYGDTRYQRYDCLKTYAFTPEDENQVIEIASFMCETRVNMLGRYDKNIGNLSNLNADPTNFNLFNPVYSQKDNFFNYRILDSDIYKLDKFNNTITWSKEKYAGEDVDTWTNITMANTVDLDGAKGKVTKLLTFKDQIFAFQDKGISNILFNSRVQIPVSDGVPIEISNGMKVEGFRYISDNIGCQNKNSIVTTPSGVYFLDSESNGIYLLADGLTNLSTNKGFDIWTKEVSKDPSFKSFYDKNEKDVYFTTKDYCLGYSEKLGQFTSFYDYTDVETMFNIGTGFYSIKEFVDKENKEYQELHQHSVGNYNEFYGEIKPYYLTIISNDDPQVDKVFTNLDYRADFFDSNNNYLENESFDTLEVWNEYQSGKETLKYSKFKPSNLKKKFRIWGADIPRDKKNKLDRMRNPWLYIKLSKENPGTSKMELHDLVVKYLE